MVDKNQITKLYLSGMTTREVAATVGCSRSSAGRIVFLNGISRPRKQRDKYRKSRGSSCKTLDASFVEYLDGLLLSDGHLSKFRGLSEASMYCQSSVSKEWLLKIQTYMFSYGIKSKITADRRPQYKHGVCWVLTTNRYYELGAIRQRWYQETKIVPLDLRLTPICVKNWLYGDGTLISGRELRFCTDSFTRNEIDYLVKSLNGNYLVDFSRMFYGKSKFGIDKFRIKINGKYGIEKFYKSLGECDVEYFKYKWFKN